MADVGANPARIIPAWRRFVAEHAGTGTALRGIGEPIYPERSSLEMVECHRHEALLNVAFADTPAFRLVCPYDTTALPADVVETARRTHPTVVADGVRSDSALFDGLDAIAVPFADPLPDPPAGADELEVRVGAFAPLRRLVARRAAAAGLDADRAHDLVLAANEIATNSVRHGGGRGRALVWTEPDAVLCELRDAGRIADPLAGRREPARGQIGGHGLWLANQLCDLVQVRSSDAGTVVRLLARLP
jgi:anti-sigma regulatory factor (Ser/Thr protein kinase)